MKKLSLIPLIFVFAATARGAAVSINFLGNSGETYAISTGEFAGAYLATYWNNVTASGAPLVDDTGAGSAITVDYTSGGWSNQYVGNTTADDKLFRGYLDISGTLATITLNGLDAGTTYQVYLYSDGENTNGTVPQQRTGNFTLGGVSTGIIDAENANFAGDYTEVAEGVTGTGNYTIFTISGSSSYTLTAQGTEAIGSPNVLRAPINGLQIVAIPEPSLSLLSALSLLPLLRRRR